MEKHFDDNEIIVSKTDLNGRITYGNQIFIKLSGYSEKELLGRPHNIIRHPDMPKVVFSLLWEGIKSRKEVPAYVKNLSKDGFYYWVLAFVTPSFDEEGNIIGYHSIRIKPKVSAISVIEPLYQRLLTAEKNGGLEASKMALGEILNKEGINYERFILSL